MSHTIKFTRVKNDINGNHRFVCHFLNFIFDTDCGKGIDIYKLALKRARKLGGRKFHNKQYGGGVVFQMYAGEDAKMTELINELLKTI